MTRDPSMLASDPDVSAWVAANAGAGKTYTLANRVARLLLADAEPQKILCLTFTRAAVAEMLGFPATPTPIIINESLEVARRYSAPESINFLNGVLDAIAKSRAKAS